MLTELDRRYLEDTTFGFRDGIPEATTIGGRRKYVSWIRARMLLEGANKSCSKTICKSKVKRYIKELKQTGELKSSFADRERLVTLIRVEGLEGYWVFGNVEALLAVVETKTMAFLQVWEKTTSVEGLLSRYI